MPITHIPAIRAVFVQLPKAAGTSLRAALAGPHGVQGPVEAANPCPLSWPLERSFAVVRHPFDRFLSACAYLKICQQEAIDILHDQSVQPTPNKRHHRGHALYHLLPQTHPYNRLYLAAHQLRFESLEKDLAALAKELAFTPPELPHLNQSEERPPWSKAIRPKQRKQLLEIYCEDFEQLGYKLPKLPKKKSV